MKLTRKNLRHLIRRQLVEATEYEDALSRMMDSGPDGVVQAMNLAQSLGIPTQELPWDTERVAAFMSDFQTKQIRRQMAVGPENAMSPEEVDVELNKFLKPTGWTIEEWTRKAHDRIDIGHTWLK